MDNGMAALRAIDVHRSVAENSYPAATVETFDAAGRHLSGRPITGEARTLTRAALYRVLQAEARSRGVRIEYGRRLASASRGPAGGVLASFVDGSRAEGDFLV